MLHTKDFYELLQKSNFEFFTGVPDSLLQDICAYITDIVPSSNHIIAANEGTSIGIASGYHLATHKVPLVYFQNSGLGNTINPLTSLADKEVYSIPMLLMIGWRGKLNVHDEPQHIKMGRIQNALLNVLEIPHAILPINKEQAKLVVERARHYVTNHNSPFALLVNKDTFEPYKYHLPVTENFELTREKAIEEILQYLNKEDCIISTTGKASRELYEIREKRNESHKKDFLTVGSMGQASSIAFSIALQKKDRHVWCIDGDGALIMHMGSLAVIGQYKAANLFHVVINNYAHESVGGQPTAAVNINIPKIAEACGYRKTYSVENKNNIGKTIIRAQKEKGPILIEIKCNTHTRKNLGRPDSTPMQNKEDFMQFLK